jgi:type IV pilus assembly protein PilC
MALTFEYKVRDRQGNLVEGQLEADSMSLVVSRLREMGYLPISVKPRSRLSGHTEITIPGLTNRVKLAELAVATRQLATMIDSGLSVVRSLAILATQVESKELARVLGEVRLEVERGSSLSAACAQHPKVFSHLFVTMVQAGEAGGSLDAVLQQLATTMEKQAALNRKIRSAMTYPAVVLTVMVVIFTALLVFVVPIFKRIFTQLHATLPGPTQAVLKVSAIVTSPWVLVVLGVLVVGLVAFRRWIGTDRGRRAFDGFKLKPPVFGPLLHKVALARFAGTLSSLVAAGVPILESLDICSDTSGNQVVADALQSAKNGVREGRSLADCLKEHEAVVPSLVTQMVEVGEQTGALDAMLRKAADFYDQEVETTVANLTQLLEPMLTVIMGAGVGTMVICMYLPMFDYIKHVPTS